MMEATVLLKVDDVMELPDSWEEKPYARTSVIMAVLSGESIEYVSTTNAVRTAENKPA